MGLAIEFILIEVQYCTVVVGTKLEAGLHLQVGMVADETCCVAQELERSSLNLMTWVGNYLCFCFEQCCRRS